MAVYYCERCGNYKDSDWNVCCEDPRGVLYMVCEDCRCDIEEEMEWENAEHDGNPEPN